MDAVYYNVATSAENNILRFNESSMPSYLNCLLMPPRETGRFIQCIGYTPVNIASFKSAWLKIAIIPNQISPRTPVYIKKD